MKTIVLLCLGLTLTYARFIYDSESEDTSIDSYETEYGLGCWAHCHCCSRGCWCHAHKSGVYLSITLMTDETDKSKDAQIDANFVVASKPFSMKFDINKREEFCTSIKGEDYCFVVDVKKATKDDKIPTYIELTKPVKIVFNCTEVPLMITGDDVMKQVRITGHDVKTTDSYDEHDNMDFIVQ